jgi:hypothetical protein
MSVGSKLGGPGQGEALKSTFIAVLLTNVSKVEISPLHCIALEVMARVMWAGFLCKRVFVPYAKDKNRAAWLKSDWEFPLKGRKIPLTWHGPLTSKKRRRCHDRWHDREVTACSSGDLRWGGSGWGGWVDGGCTFSPAPPMYALGFNETVCTVYGIWWTLRLHFSSMPALKFVSHYKMLHWRGKRVKSSESWRKDKKATRKHFASHGISENGLNGLNNKYRNYRNHNSRLNGSYK